MVAVTMGLAKKSIKMTPRKKKGGLKKSLLPENIFGTCGELRMPC